MLQDGMLVSVISNSICLQYNKQTTKIPGNGALNIAFPVAYSSTNYAVVGTMAQLSTAGNSRLFIINRGTAAFDADWTDASHVDKINWISIGY